jgi:glycosyltransferase involved in cell wall biosynthesis
MVGPQPLLSIVIPAYNASATIAVTIRSILEGGTLAGGYEIIAVDDGSIDSAQLRKVLAAFPDVQLLEHSQNRGSCAARNTGIAASRGEFIIILDADDWFVPDWAVRFQAIVQRLPPSANVCFSACRTPDNRPTVHKPYYEGWLDARSYVRDIYGGEHLPIFRGDYVRAKPYVELKSCGSISYFQWVQESPFYVVPDVLRIYDDRRVGSLTNTFVKPIRAEGKPTLPGARDNAVFAPVSATFPPRNSQKTPALSGLCRAGGRPSGLALLSPGRHT